MYASPEASCLPYKGIAANYKHIAATRSAYKGHRGNRST